jgi:signal transduction histidine kinase
VQLDGGSEGVGLGLALVRRHADQLGHRVSVRSVPGHGTTFGIELPLDDSAAPLSERSEPRP